jgi:hypothetical protein
LILNDKTKHVAKNLEEMNIDILTSLEITTAGLLLTQQLPETQYSCPGHSK